MTLYTTGYIYDYHKLLTIFLIKNLPPVIIFDVTTATSLYRLDAWKTGVLIHYATKAQSSTILWWILVFIISSPNTL